VLALAGGTVRAARLEISPLRIGCSIAVHDSLWEGQSQFQAELGRVKDILAMSREHHVLFLFDELLSGTNSKDRFFGAKAILSELVKCNSIGLVTTHDLSLTELVGEFLGTGRNVHFEEYYREGRMHFDYRMRSGILAHTNGMNIINALGLWSR
jgi:DNA mismatch repair ATPase MutS